MPNPNPNRDVVGSSVSAGASGPAPSRPSTMSIATPSVGPPAPPPRPRVTSDLAPPQPADRPPRPRSIGIAVSCWTAGGLVALMAFVAAYTDRASVRDRLTATAVAEDPTIAADVLRDGVGLTMATVLVANALLLLLAVLCLVLALRGRRAARWVLAVLGLLILLAIDVDQSFVAGGFEGDRALLWVVAALVAVGTVALLTRSSGNWIRALRR